VRITRKDIRECCGLSEAGVRVHADRLVELDYLLPHHGRNGQRFCYELLFDGDAEQDAPRVMGLFDVTTLDNATPQTSQDINATSQSAKPDLVRRSQAARGPLAVPSQGAENPSNASADAALPLVAALDPPTALLAPRRTKASYRNGAAVGA
jgi:hypothetical protein